MRLRSIVGRLFPSLVEPSAPPAPNARMLALAKAAALKMIAESNFPGEWQERADGKVFRVLSMRWVEGRGVVPEIEWR